MKPRDGVKHLLVTVCFFFVVAGCAFGTRHATLVYPPEEETKDPGTGVAEAFPTSGIFGQPIVLLQFADKRSNRQVIGKVQNTFGMDTADVVTTDSVTEWVTEALKMELRKAGYEVMSRESLEAPGTARVVGGEVLSVHCTAYFSYDGKVSFLAWVKEDNRELLKKQYTGEGSVGTNWAATARSYSYSLSLALADAISRFVADLDALMARE